MRSSPISFFSFLSALWKAFREDAPLRRHDVRKVILRQIYFTGNEALRIVVGCSFIVSAAILSRAQSGPLEISNSWSVLFVTVFIRELAPLVAVGVVIARSISATAAELATMRVQGELDSLRAAGVSPLSYLIVPRVIGGALSTFFLSIYFVIVALVTGYFALRINLDLGINEYWETFLSALDWGDFVLWSGKTLILGLLSFLLAAYFGLCTRGASFEIPQATSKAVMSSLLCSLVVQISVSMWVYLEFFV